MVMQSQDKAAFQRIGQQIAAHLQKQPLAAFTPRQWQGLLADLAGGHSDLKTPLWDLTQRPLFLNLWQHKDRTHRAIAREALLQQLQSMFAPQVVEALGEVLDGLIAAQQEGSTPVAALQDAPQPPLPQPPRSNPEAANPDPLSHASGAGSGAAAAKRRRRLLPHGLQQKTHPLLLAALMGIGLLGGVIALSGPGRCSIPGSCPPVSLTAEQQRTLMRAHQLARQLNAAPNLGSYQALAEKLQRQLDSLKAVPFTPEQAGQYRTLQSIAAAARTTAVTETGISRRLDQVSAWLGAAPQSDGSASPEQRAKARSALVRIGSTRFSQQRLQSLRDSLRTLEPLAAPAAQLAPEAPGSESTGDVNVPAHPRALPQVDPPAASGRGASRSSASGWGDATPALPAPVPRPRPLEPAPAPAPAPVPEATIASPLTPAVEAGRGSSGEYRLPEKWEQRRRRRREIMTQYENSGQ
ncbi:MAG: hypothetical protein ACKOXO_01870 [Cyanobium sp.]